MVERSKEALADFISEFVSHNPHGQLNLVAHSIGCRLLTSALELLKARSPMVLSGINEVIFAAADVDQGVFERVVNGFSSLVVRTTAYVSDRDVPLWFSKFWHTYHRVGLFPPVFEHHSVDTIKVVPDDFLTFYHSYLSEDRPVLSDIHYVLKTGFAPDRRHGMERESRNVWLLRP
jgi:esterase/lipase superfamily enzyme